nr:cache domain-containing protein [Pseudomonas sp.]
MIATSLRTRVFLLIAAIVVLVTAILMAVSLRGVTLTVYGAEERAAANTLRLVSLDIESRYRHLLREKIASVRGHREQLENHGATIEATLRAFAAMSAERNESLAAAQRIALDWINTLPRTDGMQVMVYDQSLRVLAHPMPHVIGTSLAELRDIKGQALARTAYTQSGQFGVYQWPGTDSGEMDTHFGYFRRFDEWDWVVVVSNHAGEVQRDIERKRNDIVLAVSDTLARLTLARAGFVFVFSGDGQVVIPPPARASHLLDTGDAGSGRSLPAVLSELAMGRGLTKTSFTPDDGETWELGAAYIKPLNW